MIFESKINLKNKNKDELISLLNDSLKIIKNQSNTINKMAQYISTLDIEEDICVNIEKNKTECDQMAYGECEECIIKYFENL
ncbi:MAG: hypothetical protein ACI4VQ_06235 [Clostridia bacterium]